MDRLPNLIKISYPPCSGGHKVQYLEAFELDNLLHSIYNEHLLVLINEGNVSCV